jgi:hypothetical protein
VLQLRANGGGEVKLPKTLQRYAAIIESMDNERFAGNGYWVYPRGRDALRADVLTAPGGEQMKAIRRYFAKV